MGWRCRAKEKEKLKDSEVSARSSWVLFSEMGTGGDPEFGLGKIKLEMPSIHPSEDRKQQLMLRKKAEIRDTQWALFL